MESINERIAFIVKAKSGNSARFSELLETSPQYINKLMKPGGSVGIEPISKILKIFPDIDARWLILGEGDPFIRTKKEEAIRSTIDDRVKTLISLEKYIPVMSGEDLDILGEAFNNGVLPDFDPYKFTVWEALLNDVGRMVEDRVSEAMKKGVVCRTKKVD